MVKDMEGKPKALLLSGAMCRNGESVEELIAKAHRLIEKQINFKEK